MPITKPIIADRIETTAQGLVISVAGQDYRISWEQCSPKLAAATDQQRAEAELSPSGYGIHWSTIDEDLAVGTLISA
ncbi:MAG: DUF2442 domain-containing protein [Phycisphaerales bacterium]|jgi:hypothetical protein|nr:DUF2442 domain-containing protein [Phycisphaerales bacterium]